MTKRLGALLVLAAMAASLPALPSYSQENPQYTVAPGPGSSTQDGYYVVRAEPGGSSIQTLALRNDGGQELDLRLVAVDARTSDVGGVSYNLEDELKRDIGAWISLESDSLRLPPGESRLVSFTISVPSSARPGTHLGGISVWVPKQEAAASPAGPGASIVARSRRVVAVQVDLPSAAGSHLTITGVLPAARPSGLFLDIQIVNDGFALTKGVGFIELPSEGFRQNLELDTFVPDTSIAYPIKWADSVNRGRFTGRVEIRYDGKLAIWDGSFTVGETEERQFRERFVPPGGGSVPAGGSLPAWLPGVGIGLITGFLIPVTFWLIILSRRRRKKEPEPETGDATTEKPFPPASGER